MMRSIRYCLLLLTIYLTASCAPAAVQAQRFTKGADISWLPQMEATGYVFRDANGKPQDCFQILKDHGINAIRLRTFVNPSQDIASGHCSKDETVVMAQRAKKWGMDVGSASL